MRAPLMYRFDLRNRPKNQAHCQQQGRKRFNVHRPLGRGRAKRICTTRLDLKPSGNGVHLKRTILSILPIQPIPCWYCPAVWRSRHQGLQDPEAIHRSDRADVERCSPHVQDVALPSPICNQGQDGLAKSKTRSSPTARWQNPGRESHNHQRSS